MAEDVVVGIDGYPRGWVAVAREGDSWRWATAVIADIGSLIPRGAVVGIDMPIGLVDAGERECDRLARNRLPGAGSRVFTTPPRPVLELGLTAHNDDVQRLSRALMGKGVSRQALTLSTRILALDAMLRGRPDAGVLEVHPEVSFTVMNDSPPLASKKTAAGVGQRFAAIRTWLTDVDAVLTRAPSDVPVDDALDALSCLWTAQRWRDGVATTIPEGVQRPPFIAV
jgi:predicted RNase H-like nuclease